MTPATLYLSNENRTADAEIIRIADFEDRFVVAKDADFAHSFLLSGQPSHLLLVSARTALIVHA